MTDFNRSATVPTPFPNRRRGDRKCGETVERPNWLQHFAIVASVLLSGCWAVSKPEPITEATVQERILQLEQHVRELSGRAVDGALHALSSADPEMRAQAAIAFAKTGGGTTAVFDRLEELALHDEDPVVRAAGLTAICRIRGRSDRVRTIVRQLASDPQVGLVARSLEATAKSR